MTNKKPGFGILEVIIIIVVLGIIATLGWVFFFKPDTKDVNEEPAKQTTSSGLQPEDVTKKIKETLAKEFTILDIEKNNQPTEKEISVGLAKHSPAYKVPGYDYYVTYDGGSELTLLRPETKDMPSVYDKEVREKIASLYHEMGLESTESITYTDTEVTTNIYEGNGLICTIDAPSSQVGSTTATCGAIAAYDAAAKKVQPLSQTIEYTDGTTVFAEPTIKDSSVSGYKQASMSVSGIKSPGGSVALFWKKGRNNWQLFTYTQNSLPCENYTTEDVRNAFKGETCYDNTSDSESKVGAKAS
jgi:hypothetical protein